MIGFQAWEFLVGAGKCFFCITETKGEQNEKKHSVPCHPQEPGLKLDESLKFCTNVD